MYEIEFGGSKVSDTHHRLLLADHEKGSQSVVTVH